MNYRFVTPLPPFPSFANNMKFGFTITEPVVPTFVFVSFFGPSFWTEEVSRVSNSEYERLLG